MLAWLWHTPWSCHGGEARVACIMLSCHFMRTTARPQLCCLSGMGMHSRTRTRNPRLLLPSRPAAVLFFADALAGKHVIELGGARARQLAFAAQEAGVRA